jgi:hypothetical protein
MRVITLGRAEETKRSGENILLHCAKHLLFIPRPLSKKINDGIARVTQDLKTENFASDPCFIYWANNFLI